jgi:hypothetical protein
MNRILHRTLSIALSAMLTLSMLGGIDRLSQPTGATEQWAQQTSVRA